MDKLPTGRLDLVTSFAKKAVLALFEEDTITSSQVLLSVSEFVISIGEIDTLSECVLHVACDYLLDVLLQSIALAKSW